MSEQRSGRSDATRLRSRRGQYTAECEFCGCPEGCACEGQGCACGTTKGLVWSEHPVSGARSAISETGTRYVVVPDLGKPGAPVRAWLVTVNGVTWRSETKRPRKFKTAAAACRAVVAKVEPMKLGTMGLA